MASLSPSSSSSSTAAKSHVVAAAEKEPGHYSPILPNEAATSPPPLPTHDYIGKTKMPQFFHVLVSEPDKTAPTETGVSTDLGLNFGPPTMSKTGPSMPLSSYSCTHLSDHAAAATQPHYSSTLVTGFHIEEATPPLLPHDYKGKRKMPEFFHVFASQETKQTATLPAYDDKGKRKMPEFFDVFASQGKPDDETAPTETGLSTHLSLHLGPPPTIKQRKTAAVSPRNSPPRVVVPSNLPALLEMGVSTQLSLDFGPPTTRQRQPAISPRNVVPSHLHNQWPALPGDRWKIKKVLTQSDVDGSSRLLVGKVLVQEHILPHVMGNPEEGEGVEVKVWDVDTASGHMLFLKFQKTSKCYVFKKNWMSDFVRRRDLKKNDEIGVGWDNQNSRLEFTVLLKNN